MNSQNILDAIRLSPHNPEWAKEFQQEKQRILHLIEPSVIDIQHIGSTSIPSISAKPIIDILIALVQPGLTANHMTSLQSLGYLYEGQVLNLAEHHFFRKGMPRTHHIHIADFESDFWHRHILFRDYLRAHIKEAKRYNQLKHELSKKFEFDRKSYTMSKTPLIESILANARSWKATLG
ncbi:MAG: GrpB family protein [Kaiparowitsia implicata GSE-PSE-MK54-09C]|jgi:GrpB-like predicted nucleotidyltransferase (UPF0157 family)|nr:GrpB family protein [Kaiparowitsia implicata GSE-PSE-MK54-09C]